MTSLKSINICGIGIKKCRKEYHDMYNEVSVLLTYGGGEVGGERKGGRKGGKVGRKEERREGDRQNSHTGTTWSTRVSGLEYEGNR